MTIKERIKAFVLEQGNQVGAGAELAAILNDIVDAIPGEYTLPSATAQTLGGIKVGENLSIDEQGVLSASGGGGIEPYFVQDGAVEGSLYQQTVIVVPQEEYARAKAAFLAGRPVIVPEIDTMAYSVVGYSRGATLDETETPVEGLVLFNSDKGDASMEGVAIAIVAQV